MTERKTIFTLSTMNIWFSENRERCARYNGGVNTQHIGIQSVLKFGLKMVQDSPHFVNQWKTEHRIDPSGKQNRPLPLEFQTSVVFQPLLHNANRSCSHLITGNFKSRHKIIFCFFGQCKQNKQSWKICKQGICHINI